MSLKTYFLSADRQSQIACTMDDALHAHIWGRMSYRSAPYDGVALVEVVDARVWIDAQIAVRVADAKSQARMIETRIAATQPAFAKAA